MSLPVRSSNFCNEWIVKLRAICKTRILDISTQSLSSSVKTLHRGVKQIKPESSCFLFRPVPCDSFRLASFYLKLLLFCNLFVFSLVWPRQPKSLIKAWKDHPQGQNMPQLTDIRQPPATPHYDSICL